MHDQEHAEDVSALYAWANLKGAKYRDFSAERQQQWTESRSRGAGQDTGSVTPEEVEPENAGADTRTASATDSIERALVDGTERTSGEQNDVPERSPDLQVADDTEKVRSEKPRWVALDGTRSQGPRSVASAPLPDATPGNTALQWPFLQKSMARVSEEEGYVENGSSLSFSPLIFASMAGGAGKTNLVANLGCALASDGESSLLVETSSAGVLPYYFGCKDSRTGVVRTFESDSDHAPVQVFTLGRDEHAGNCISGRQVYDTLMRFGGESQRVIADIAGDPSGILPQILPLNPVVVVPVVPDTRSVLGLQVIEDLLESNRKKEFGQHVQPYYLLNRFESSIPFHQHVREAMHQRFGDRLLPFVIRESDLVDEALAHGVSVFDYSPDSEVAQDLWRLVEWVRKTVSARTSASRLPRWSER